MNGPLALICAGCETYFYIGVSKEVGANAGRITLGILIFSVLRRQEKNFRRNDLVKHNSIRILLSAA